MNIDKLKRSTQIAIMTGAGSGTVEKTVTGAAPLTLSDSVAGNLLGITINGRSVISAGSIVSVGDTGLTVTTANSDSTVTTSAEVITSLPLRGVSDTVRDKLICTADTKQVETVCGEVDLGTLNWAYYSASATPIFYTALSNINAKAKNANMLCTLYTPENGFWNEPNNDMKIATSTNDLFISNSQYTNPSDFKAAMNGVMLVYELATPVTTPLTDAEISALTALITYDSTTTISVTDNPSITVKYMGKRASRTAPKKRTNRKKKS